MIFSALLILATGFLFVAWRLGRRRRRALAWRRWVLAVGVFLCGFMGLLGLVSSGYMFWYTHRSQPEAVREELFRGISYAREVRSSPREMVIHAVTIDLHSPGVRFFVTPGKPTAGCDLSAMKTSGFLKKFKLQMAINANYFYPFRSESPWDYFPHTGDGVNVCGFAASEGNVYSNKSWRPGTLYISKENRATFDTPMGAVYNAISGGGFILKDGVVQPPPLIADEKDQPYPRAALGLSKDRERMFLFVIDGKQPGYSMDATLTELGQIVLEHGAEDAIRLDEGGSCALAAEDLGGGVRMLNVPINNRIPYRERVVANQLGVFAERVR